MSVKINRGRLSWRVTGGVVAAVISLVLSAIVGLIPAYAVSTNIGWEQINANSNMCMGIENGSSANPAPVIQWPCNSHTDQSWNPPYPLVGPIGGPGLIVNLGANNRCLGTANGEITDGTKIVSKACNSNNTDELWQLVHTTTGWFFKNFKANYTKCLGVPGLSTHEGVQLVLWTCNGHIDQRWLQGNETIIS